MLYLYIYIYIYTIEFGAAKRCEIFEICGVSVDVDLGEVNG